MDGWNDFFVATAGASAALTGLIFVGISISLAKILSIGGLADRALISLFLLISILVLSLLLLIPKQSLTVLGIEILVISSVIWVVILKINISVYRKRETKYTQQYRMHILFNQVAVIPYLIGGILLFTSGETGLYWVVTGITCSFIKAVLDAWVLLVEIHR